MTDHQEKKGFWGGLLRRASTRRSSKATARFEVKDQQQQPQQQHHQQQQQQQQPPRRASDAGETIQLRRRRTMPEREPPPPLPGVSTSASTRRRPRRPQVDFLRDLKPRENGTHPVNGRVVHTHGPLGSWPPSGMSSQEELPPQHAMELVARGVPSHKGQKRPVAHAGEEFYSLYATSVGNRGEGTDVANLHDSMTQMMTLRMIGPGHSVYPWDTLEQPSCAFRFGHLPGTITLNHWASMASVLPPAIALRDSGVVPRPMTLERIFERLLDLRFGLDEDESYNYKSLYKRILRDPDKILSPHKTLDKQITDLILVLSRPDWIDFTSPRNQVVTRFIFDTSEENTAQYHKFFHQLLLSVELDVRIQSPQHGDWAKEKLLQQIPPTIQWNLALARRWQDYVRVDDFGATPEDILLRYKLKKRQVKMLRRFAQMMKWPNLDETLENLKRKDSELALDDISSDAFSFFSGLILPGPTFPFLIMNTLLDLDPDTATDNLALLSHIHPQCGFQYRDNTYWSATCIVGKVLAPTCHSVAGWVGPARPTQDMARSQIARIRSRRPKQRMTPEDVESMAERSDPLGPPAEVFPIHEYKLVLPGVEESIDTVRVELLSLRGSDRPDETTMSVAGPRQFDATVQFAIDGVSWPLRLMYDVSFVTAWPCSDGPHPLFFDYVYQSIKIDEIVNIRDWGGLYGGQAALSVRSSPGPERMRGHHQQHVMFGFHAMAPPEEDEDEEDDEEKVLVVEAFGVRDNEVLARAWCSHWGLSAIVADIRNTCMACAIREAYAATLTVVILVEGQMHEGDE